MRWFILSIISSMAIADLAWWWFADIRLRVLRRATTWRLLLAAFMVGQIGVLTWVVLGRLFGADTFTATPGILMTATYVWHLLVLPLCVAILLVATAASIVRRAWAWAMRGGRPVGALGGGVAIDCASDVGAPLDAPHPAAAPRSAPHPAAAPRGAPHPAAAPPPSPVGGRGDREAPTRRQFLGAVVAAAPPLLAGAGIGAAVLQSGHFRIRRLAVELPGLPPALDGLRIAQVADMHVGRFTEGPVLRRIVEATSRLDADLVLLPGDLINNSLGDLPAALDAVSNMQSRHGSYLCLGNHDLIDNGAEFIARTKTRLPLLVDERATVRVRGEEIALLGLPWLRDEPSMSAAVRSLAAGVRPGAVPILLAHHPHAFDAAAAAGIPLTLSGHTHGGQLMLPGGLGFGPLMFRYWSGLYRKPEQGNAALVVSNGVGNWLPVRTNAPAEIVEITLRRQARA